MFSTDTLSLGVASDSGQDTLCLSSAITLQGQEKPAWLPPRLKCHEPQGAQPLSPHCPCRLSPAHTRGHRSPPALTAAPSGRRAREPSTSLFFHVFPLNPSGLMPPSLGRFLSQKHSPKTSAPGPALAELTLCGPAAPRGRGSLPGGRGGLAPAGAASPLINPELNH